MNINYLNVLRILVILAKSATFVDNSTDQLCIPNLTTMKNVNSAVADFSKYNISCEVEKNTDATLKRIENNTCLALWKIHDTSDRIIYEIGSFVNSTLSCINILKKKLESNAAEKHRNLTEENAKIKHELKHFQNNLGTFGDRITVVGQKVDHLLDSIRIFFYEKEYRTKRVSFNMLRGSFENYKNSLDDSIFKEDCFQNNPRYFLQWLLDHVKDTSMIETLINSNNGHKSIFNVFASSYLADAYLASTYVRTCYTLRFPNSSNAVDLIAQDAAFMTRSIEEQFMRGNHMISNYPTRKEILNLFQSWKQGKHDYAHIHNILNRNKFLVYLKAGMKISSHCVWEAGNTLSLNAEDEHTKDNVTYIYQWLEDDNSTLKGCSYKESWKQIIRVMQNNVNCSNAKNVSALYKEIRDLVWNNENNETLGDVFSAIYIYSSTCHQIPGAYFRDFEKPVCARNLLGHSWICDSFVIVLPRKNLIGT